MFSCAENPTKANKRIVMSLHAEKFHTFVNALGRYSRILLMAKGVGFLGLKV